MFQNSSPFTPEMPGVPAMMPSGGGEVSDAEAREFLLDQIVLHEWDMFQEVNPAVGEEQFPSFKVKRSCQLAGWPTAVVLNYLQDVSYAVEAGRNLIMEKYAYMMEQTAPEYFNETLADQMPGLTMEAEQVLNQIMELRHRWNEEFDDMYPALSRVLPAPAARGEDGTDPREVYIRGELRTYSTGMLVLYGKMIRELDREGRNLVIEENDMLMRARGFKSIEAAEAHYAAQQA